MAHSAHIVIVNYNSGDWLRRAVSSALDCSQAMVTVVDNASSDDSLFHAQQSCDSERVSWVANDLNLGFAAANNQVLKDIDTEYSVLMNPDCELHADTLSLIFKAFNDHPEFGIASCRILNEDHTLQPTCRRRFPTPWSAMVRMLQLHRLFPNSARFANFDYGSTVSADEPPHAVEAISGAFMVVKNSAMREVGLLDEGYFMHCEDLDWCKRFELAGWQVGFVPAAEVLHAKGVSSKSRPVGVLWTLHKGMNRFFDKFYQSDIQQGSGSLMAVASAFSLRLFVKVGIYLSFLMRAATAVAKGVLSKKPKT